MGEFKYTVCLREKKKKKKHEKKKINRAADAAQLLYHVQACLQVSDEKV